MAQFMLLFVGLAAPTRADDPLTQAYEEKWADWMGGLARDGALVSGGPFLATGKRVGRDATYDLLSETVDLGGYALLDVASIDDAAGIARRAPHTALGGSTIVRPIMARA
jgi:hypothetical protein